MKGPLTFILGLTLAGCVQSRPPYALRTPFLDSDFRPWSKPGPAAISGQAFLRTVGGDVKTCAGQDVSLMPGTQYNEGRFSFGGLSARPWIVVVDVTWSVPGENGLERQGGVLSKTVDVPGQMRSFYLARTKFPSVSSFLLSGRCPSALHHRRQVGISPTCRRWLLGSNDWSGSHLLRNLAREKLAVFEIARGGAALDHGLAAQHNE